MYTIFRLARILTIVPRVSQTYRYRFRRYGRSRQLEIATAADLLAAADLDPALWVATSMPTKGVCVDPAFLGYLDADETGRVTHGEIVEIIDWTLGVLRDHRQVESRSDHLQISSIDPDHPEGKALIETIRRMIESTTPGSDTADASISIGEIATQKAELLKRPVSDSGIILPAAAQTGPVKDELGVRRCIELAIETTGGTRHPTGEVGLDAASLDRFVSLCERYRGAVCQQSEIEASDIDESFERYRRFHDIIDKLEEYFSLCAAEAFVHHAPEITTATGATMPADLPLAKPRADGVITFGEFLNPLYIEPLEDFRTQVLAGIGLKEATSLSAHEWVSVRGRFERSRRVCEELDLIGADVVARLTSETDLESLVAPEVIAQVRDLIRVSREERITVDQVRKVERLALSQRYLLDLANNFVSFPDLYDRSARAWFEMGRLVIDNRTFGLAVHVEQRVKHVSMARNSHMHVLYVQLRRQGDAVVSEVAVPVTAGGRGNLAVGKRGIFIDRKGDELDAEIVEIIENPISIGEAIIAPIRKLTKTVTGKFESLTTAADQELQRYVGATVDQIGHGGVSGSGSATGATTGAHAAAGGGGRPGVGTALLGGSVAVAAIGSALAYIINTLSSLSWLQILGGFGGAIGAVVIPAIAFAMLKLRRRDLSAVIEASGWAVNIRMKLSRRLQRVFTATPVYPARAKGAPIVRRRWIGIIGSGVLIAVAIIVVLLIVL